MKKLFRLFKRETTTLDLIDFLIKNNIRFDCLNDRITVCIFSFYNSCIYICLTTKKALYSGINVKGGSDYDTIIKQLKKTL